jgi:6-phosphogluconolactonase
MCSRKGSDMHVRLFRRGLVAAAGAALVLLSAVTPALAHDRGAVYTLSNQASNAVVLFDRGHDGGLTQVASFLTGGAGTGAGLGSQGALTRSGDLLFAVNAGSDEVSVFRIKRHGLRLVDRLASGGDQPISITVHRRLVYVVNAGGAGNISGFYLTGRDRLVPLFGSTQPLASAGSGPAQIAFQPDGSRLVVTEKAANAIETFEIGRYGRALPGVVHASAGQTPFGFDFAGDDTLVISEAFGGAAGASALSSYDLAGGGFTGVTSSSPTHQTAACWVVTTRDGRFAYTANTGSGTVTGYAVADGGALSLLDADGITGVTGTDTRPADADLTRGDRFLYVLDSGTGQISGFAVGADGSLEPVSATPAGGLPAGTAGLVAR